MNEMIVSFFNRGSLFLFIPLAIEGTGVPGIPSWLLFLRAGYLIEEGKMSFSYALLVATAGNVLGNLFGYFLGVMSRNLLHYGDEESSRGPRWHLIDKKDLEMAKGWLSKYGAFTILIGRWFGAIRAPSIFAAGFTAMDIKKYMLFSLLASSTWVLIWQFGAWKLRGPFMGFIESHERLSKYFLNPEVIFLITFTTMICGYILLRIIKRRHG